MPRATDIMPITDFTRNYKKVIAKLKKTGRPFVLTIDGKPALVIQDAGSFDHRSGLLSPAELEAAADVGRRDTRPRLTIEQLRTALRPRSAKRAG